MNRFPGMLIVAIALELLSFGAVAGRGATEPTTQPFATTQPFGSAHREVIAHPVRVEARRVWRVFAQGPIGPHGEYPVCPGGAEFEIRYSASIALKPAVASRLSDVLLDPGTYSQCATFCFNPGVEFVFHHGDTRVSVLVCFHCRNLSGSLTGPNGDEVASLLDFDPGYPRLAHLTKEIFPKDEEIQAIEEKSLRSGQDEKKP